MVRRTAGVFGWRQVTVYNEKRFAEVRRLLCSCCKRCNCHGAGVAVLPCRGAIRPSCRMILAGLTVPTSLPDVRPAFFLLLQYKDFYSGSPKGFVRGLKVSCCFVLRHACAALGQG